MLPSFIKDDCSKFGYAKSTADGVRLETEDSVRYAADMEQLKKILFFHPNELSRFTHASQLRVVHLKEELYHLQTKKREIARRENELLYTLQDTLLQEDCYQLTAEMDRLAKIPDERKSRQEEDREVEILDAIINIVNRRHSMLENMHVERLSEYKECEKVDDEYRKHKVALMKMMNQKEEPSCMTSDYREKKITTLKQWVHRRVNGCQIL